MSSCCSCNNFDRKGNKESSEESEKNNYEEYGGTSIDSSEESEENTSEVYGPAKKSSEKISWKKRFRTVKK